MAIYPCVLYKKNRLMDQNIHNPQMLAEMNTVTKCESLRQKMLRRLTCFYLYRMMRLQFPKGVIY